MSVEKVTPERKALNIYCQLSDLENVIDVMNFAFRAEEELVEKSSTIYWGSMISLLKKEVSEVRNLAEDLESDIRLTNRNNDPTEGQEQQSHTTFSEDFVVFPVGVVSC